MLCGILKKMNRFNLFLIDLSINHFFEHRCNKFTNSTHQTDYRLNDFWWHVFFLKIIYD
jgi:hypothetical protein